MIFLKMLLSVMIGWILGYERKKHDASGGGSRTLSIVSLGACLVAILTLQINENYPNIVHNFTRLLSYGIASIGFLSSGVIIQNKDSVTGLTTASLIWTTVIVNYFIGLGYFGIGLVAAGLVYGILESKYILGRDK